MDMDFSKSQLQIFTSLARALNFTSVAKEFYVTQPAISHQISRLEESLGVKLLDRSGRKVSLTHAGAEFYPYAVELIALSERATQHVRLSETSPGGRLRVSSVSSMYEIASSCISAYAIRHPDVSISIESGNGLQQIMAINRGECDVFFGFRSLLEEKGAFELISAPSDRFCIAARADIASVIKEGDFNSLKGIPLIAHSQYEGPYLANKVSALCKVHKFVPDIVHEYSSSLSLEMAVSAGLGYSILPHALAIRCSGDVRRIAIPGKSAIIENSIGYAKDSRNPQTEVFINIAKELFSQNDSCQ